jgi:hydroxycarboxylate dehydrogenase B
MKNEFVITPQALTAAIAAIVKTAGSEAEEAALVAGNLVEANLKGHDSHGVGMIPRYIDSLKEGGLTLNAHASVTLDSGALMSVNGNQGYGQVVAREAIALGIARARDLGTCILGLANAHHIGRIGAWAEQAAAAGLVSVHFVNVMARSIVAPWGGRDARHGTNPFCVGIPRVGAEPVILDFATSRIAQGKTRVAYNKGEQLAPNIIIDDRGNPSTDPRFTVIEPSGAILPFGEHKGSGLALICELLGGALSGGKTLSGKTDGSRKVINSMFSILIDPAKMGTGENLAREMESFVAWHIASPPAEGVDHVKIAGEPEREWKKQRLAAGIPVDPTTWQEIVAAGAKVGLDNAAIEKLAT